MKEKPAYQNYPNRILNKTIIDIWCNIGNPLKPRWEYTYLTPTKHKNLIKITNISCIQTYKHLQIRTNYHLLDYSRKWGAWLHQAWHDGLLHVAVVSFYFNFFLYGFVEWGFKGFETERIRLLECLNRNISNIESK